MKTIIYLSILIAIPLCLYGQGISIGSGTSFSLGSATLYLPNNWSNAGTFDPGTGTVVLNGAVDQSISNAAGETFLDLTVNKSGGDVKLDNNITVNGNLTLTAGDIDLNGATIILGNSAILNETAGNTVKGVSGAITTTRTLGANPGNVAGLGADISVSPALGLTTIERGHRADTVSASNSITRNYSISPANNTGLNATVVFHYDDSELNNLTEANLGLYKSTDNGLNWTSAGGTLNTTDNYITATGIQSFSKWSLFSTTNPPVDVQEKPELELPRVYALSQNYPNPFNPSTSISFDLPQRSNVVLKIYDAIGREVSTLVSGDLSAGRYTKNWDASSCPSGVYFYRISMKRTDGKGSENFISTKKLILVK